MPALPWRLAPDCTRPRLSRFGARSPGGEPAAPRQPLLCTPPRMIQATRRSRRRHRRLRGVADRDRVGKSTRLRIAAGHPWPHGRAHPVGHQLREMLARVTVTEGKLTAKRRATGARSTGPEGRFDRVALQASAMRLTRQPIDSPCESSAPETANGSGSVPERVHAALSRFPCLAKLFLPPAFQFLDCRVRRTRQDVQVTLQRLQD
jgi:hypothetical protein